MVDQTVLTATFNSYGNRQISTPPPLHKIDTAEPTDKKLAQVITLVRGTLIPNMVQIHELETSGQTGKM